VLNPVGWLTSSHGRFSPAVLPELRRFHRLAEALALSGGPHRQGGHQQSLVSLVNQDAFLSILL